MRNKLHTIPHHTIVGMSLFAIMTVAIIITRLVLIHILPPELPSNGYVLEKTTKYFVVVNCEEIEVTRDQYFYTPIGQWIDFEMAKGVPNE